MKKWETLKSEYVYKTPFGNLRKDKCLLPNNNVIDSYYVNEYSDWVNAVVLTKERNIVLVEQYRYAGEDFFLEIPAGKKEQGETNEQGILREIEEETGFTTETLPIKLGEFMVNPATQTNKVITYLITDAVKTFDQNLDENEDITVHVFDFDEMEDLIRSQRIKTQLFTANAYFMAKNYLDNNEFK
ncbi:NUDIX hydrolase [Alkalibacillus silvisoli]|uniref:NUDIX hydrolase n=1 Tax=Alkalibacillus silvisoli TaxID=392823 RepID=UPI0031E38EC0